MFGDGLPCNASYLCAQYAGRSTKQLDWERVAQAVPSRPRAERFNEGITVLACENARTHVLKEV
jgi:hypothetical protein